MPEPYGRTFAPADTGHPSPDAVARLAARIGRLLLENGADTAHAVTRMHEVATLLGVRARLLVTAEAVLIATEDGDQLHIRIGAAIPAMAVDMGALSAIEHVVDRLHAGQIDLAAAHDAFDAIERGDNGQARWPIVLGVGVTAGSLACLFGATAPVSAAAFLAGLVSTMLRLLFAKHRLNAMAAAFLTALLSGLVAEAAIAAVSGASPILCLTAAGMILVPGVPLINGVRDLLGGHAVNGVARLALGTATVLAIGFALFTAAALAGETLPVGDLPGSLPVRLDLIVSALAAAGYAMLFKVPPRAVVACMLCGMAGHGLRTALGSAGMPLAAASLVGALAAGAIARIAGRWFRMPAVTFAFPGIVAMVPGSYGFRAGIGGLRMMTLGHAAPPALVAETISSSITAAVVTVAIAIGLLLAFSVPPERSISTPAGQR